MPKGANRKILTDGMFLIQEGTRRHLGRIGKVDFAKLGGAETDIIYVWDSYNSRLLAEQNAPDQGTMTDTIETLVVALDKAMIATKALRNGHSGTLAQHEFNAAINDLLRESGLHPWYLKDTIEELVQSLDRLAGIAKELRSKLARTRQNEEVYISSSTSLRNDFYQSLHRTLSHHGLDTGVGVNSVIVELVLQLQGKASDYAYPTERRRKDLAREIKLAVKPRKGG